MATIKNARENEFTFTHEGTEHTIPGGRTVDGKFKPGSAEVPDAVLDKARKNPVVAAWFEDGHLSAKTAAKGQKPEEKKPE